MALDLDTAIFVSFLVINLAVGLFYSRGITTVREYAIGNRDFSNQSLTATIVATCIGAGIFSTSLIESYKQGLYFIIPMVAGTFLALFSTGYLLVPRMGEFRSSQSVAEVMGKLYGNKVRIVVAISGVLLSIGTVALQFKAATIIFQMLFKTSDFISVTLVVVVVGIYSSIGGIKTVTLTDKLQFFTFATIIPLICIAILSKTPESIANSLSTLLHSPLFDLKQIFDISNPRLYSSLALMFVFSIPGLDPAFFQRVLMSKSTSQAKYGFVAAGMIITFIILMICYTGVLLLMSDPKLNPNELLPHIIDNYTYVGFKGLVSIGIVAIIMSTADSYINSASVLVVHDIMGIDDKTLHPNSGLLTLRLTALSIVLFAFILAYNATDMLSLLVKTFNFYAPVVSTSLLLTIFGFRSCSKVVLMGMGAAGGVIILSEFYPIDGAILGMLGMLTNLVTFVVAHQFYGKSNNSLEADGKSKINYSLWDSNFSLAQFYRENYIQQENFYQIIGFFSLICILGQSYLIKSISSVYTNLINIIFFSSLILSFLLIIQPILPFLKNNRAISFKIFALPYVLVFVPCLLAMLNNFAQIQITILLLSVIIFMCIVRWQVGGLIFIISGLICFQSLNVFYVSSLGPMELVLKLKIIFILLLLSTVIIAFLKPKQEAAELAEEKVNHLSHVVEDQNSQIFELSNLKQTFLRNLQHETNTPITGVYSMSQALQDCYDKLTDQERKNAINTIVISAERLISYANNLIGVSKLASSGFKLRMREVNVSALLEEALRKVKRLYIAKGTEEDREFVVSIDPNIITTCDEYYIRKSFENLIINAIQYCRKGKITLSLTRHAKEAIQFSIKDSGIGIPTEELCAIFDPFTTSTKTQTPAGGRGVGLALVKAVMQAHKGTIIADSDGATYSAFTMILPSESH